MTKIKSEIKAAMVKGETITLEHPDMATPAEKNKMMLLLNPNAINEKYKAPKKENKKTSKKTMSKKNKLKRKNKRKGLKP